MYGKSTLIGLSILILLCGTATAVPAGGACQAQNVSDIPSGNYILYCTEMNQTVAAEEQPNRISQNIYANSDLRREVSKEFSSVNADSPVTTPLLLLLYSGDWEPSTKDGKGQRIQRVSDYTDRQDTRNYTTFEVSHKRTDVVFESRSKIYTRLLELEREKIDSEFDENSGDGVSVYPWMYGNGQVSIGYREDLTDAEPYSEDNSKIPVEDAYINILRAVPQTEVGFVGGPGGETVIKRTQFSHTGKIRVVMDYRGEDIPANSNTCGGLLDNSCSVGDKKYEYTDKGTTIKNSELEIRTEENTVSKEKSLSTGVNDLQYSVSDKYTGNITFNVSSTIIHKYQKDIYKWEQTGTKIVSCNVNESADCTGQKVIDCSQTFTTKCIGTNETITVSCRSGPGCTGGTKEEPIFEWVKKRTKNKSESVTVADSVSGYIPSLFTDGTQAPTMKVNSRPSSTQFEFNIPDSSVQGVHPTWKSIHLYRSTVGKEDLYFDSGRQKETIQLVRDMSARTTVSVWVHGNIDNQKLKLKLNDEIIYNSKVSVQSETAGQRKQILKSSEIPEYFSGENSVSVSGSIEGFNNSVASGTPRVWIEIENPPYKVERHEITSQWGIFYARDKGWDKLKVADEDGDSAPGGTEPYDSKYYPVYPHAIPIQNLSGGYQSEIVSREPYSTYSVYSGTSEQVRYDVPKFKNSKKCTYSYKYRTINNKPRDTLRDCDYDFGQYNKSSYMPTQSFSVTVGSIVDSARIFSLDGKSSRKIETTSESETEQAFISISRKPHKHEIDENTGGTRPLVSNSGKHNHLQDYNESWYYVKIRTKNKYNDSINMKQRDIPGEKIIVSNAKKTDSGEIEPKEFETGKNGTALVKVYKRENRSEVVSVKYVSGDWKSAGNTVIYANKTVSKQFEEGTREVIGGRLITIAIVTIILLIIIKYAAATLNIDIGILEPLDPIKEQIPNYVWTILLLGLIFFGIKYLL